ncbi:MAG: hypothetical protein AAGF83_24955 [Cyanobacteria bacterium P01_G01_bin.67]
MADSVYPILAVQRQADNIDSLDLQPCLADHPFKEKVPDLLRETHDLLGGAPVKRLSQS